MPGWLPKVLTRIRVLIASRRVVFTLKARRELASLAFGLDEVDACDILCRLTAEDLVGRLASSSTGEWLYVFRPGFSTTILYIKLVLRNDCVVISFHEDKSGSDEGEA